MGSRAKIFSALRLLALIGAALLPRPVLRADQGQVAQNPNTNKICYCGCDSASDAPMCAHPCDLAKYKDHTWATSCTKRPAPSAKKAQSWPSSKKSNKNQQARLN